jgi:hypothetical protein
MMRGTFFFERESESAVRRRAARHPFPSKHTKLQRLNEEILLSTGGLNKNYP